MEPHKWQVRANKNGWHPKPCDYAEKSGGPLTTTTLASTKGQGNTKLIFKSEETRRKEDNKVDHSAYANAMQEGDTNERAKSRAQLAAKYVWAMDLEKLEKWCVCVC